MTMQEPLLETSSEQQETASGDSSTNYQVTPQEVKMLLNEVRRQQGEIADTLKGFMELMNSMGVTRNDTRDLMSQVRNESSEVMKRMDTMITEASGKLMKAADMSDKAMHNFVQMQGDRITSVRDFSEDIAASYLKLIRQQDQERAILTESRKEKYKRRVQMILVGAGILTVGIGIGVLIAILRIR